MTEAVQNAQEVGEPQVTANEQEARSAGWVPKEEYQGDENKWVDADEFIRRGPLFEKINIQSRELKEVKKTLDAMRVHYHNVKETAFKEAIATLKAEKKAAFVDGDPDKIVEIDDKIDDIRDQQRRYDMQKAQEIAASVQAGINPEFQAWTNRNNWYETSKPMRAFADALGIELHSSGLTPSEVLKRVEIQVKEEFPHKFRNANRDKALAVESTGKGSGKSNGPSNDGLDPLQRQIMDRLVRSGVMTKEQYIADIQKINKESE